MKLFGLLVLVLASPSLSYPFGHRISFTKRSDPSPTKQGGLSVASSPSSAISRTSIQVVKTPEHAAVAMLTMVLSKLPKELPASSTATLASTRQNAVVTSVLSKISSLNA